MFPTNHLWLSDASCLHAAMPSHASSQVVRRLSQSAALTMTSALQAVEEREHRNSDTIEPQGQFLVKRICKRDFKKTSLKSMWRRLGGRKTCCTCQAYVNMIQYVEGSVLPYYNDNWYDKINSFHIRLQYLYKIVIAIWLYMFESVIIYDIIYIYLSDSARCIQTFAPHVLSSSAREWVAGVGRGSQGRGGGGRQHTQSHRHRITPTRFLPGCCGLGELRHVVERKLLSSQPSSIWTALICWPRPDSRKL